MTRCVALDMAQDSSYDLSAAEIKMCEATAKNLGVHYNDEVVVTLCQDVPFATKVHVLPYEQSLHMVTGNIFEDYIKPFFQDAYRPATKGDSFPIRGVEFCIVAIEP